MTELPRVLIVHYSRTGHTARLAEVLAAEIRLRGCDVDTEAIRVERDWNMWLLPSRCCLCCLFCPST